MASPKVEAPAFLTMFLIVCTACINKNLVEARKIEVIQQSDEPVYHTDYRGPRCNGCPEEKDKVDSYFRPPIPPSSPEEKDELPTQVSRLSTTSSQINYEQSNEPIYHTDYRGPRCNGCPEEKDELFYHTNSPSSHPYHPPNPPNSTEDKDELVYHTDRGVTTLPPSPYGMG